MYNFLEKQRDEETAFKVGDERVFSKGLVILTSRSIFVSKINNIIKQTRQYAYTKTKFSS